MTQQQLETAELGDVIPIEVGKRYMVMLTLQDIEDIDRQWLEHVCSQLSDMLTTWLQGDDPFLVVAMPRTAALTFERVPEDQMEDVLDLVSVVRALDEYAKGETVPWEKVKAELLEEDVDGEEA